MKKNVNKFLIILIVLVVIGLSIFLIFVSLKNKKETKVRQGALEFTELIEKSEVDGFTDINYVLQNYKGKFCNTYGEIDCAFYAENVADIALAGKAVVKIFYYNENGFTISTYQGGTDKSLKKIKELISDTSIEFKDKKIIF